MAPHPAEYSNWELEKVINEILTCFEKNWSIDLPEQQERPRLPRVVKVKIGQSKVIYNQYEQGPQRRCIFRERGQTSHIQTLLQF